MASNKRDVAKELRRIEECHHFDCVFYDVQEIGPCPFCADHTMYDEKK